MIVIHVEGGIVRGVYCASMMGEECVVVDEDKDGDPRMHASSCLIEHTLDMPNDIVDAVAAKCCSEADEYDSTQDDDWHEEQEDACE